MTAFKRRLSRKFSLLSCRLGDGSHEVELIAGDEGIHLCFYGDLTGSWPERWEFNC
jgi:hypothetical protein